MKVNVLYFAAAREQAGTKAETFELGDGATAADALAAACAAHPGLRAIAGQLRLAVDQRFAEGTLPLRDGVEVALIPPVAGGAGEGGAEARGAGGHPEARGGGGHPTAPRRRIARGRP